MDVFLDKIASEPALKFMIKFLVDYFLRRTRQNFEA